MIKDKISPIHNESTKTIAKRIDALSKSSNISVETILEKLVYLPKTWLRIRNGSRQLKADEVANIASLFNISCDELLRGEKPEYYRIENELGLNQKAISYLYESNIKNPKLCWTLNKILEDKEIADIFLNAFYFYISMSIKRIVFEGNDMLDIQLRDLKDVYTKTVWGVIEQRLFSAFEKLRKKNIEVIQRMSQEWDISMMTYYYDIFSDDVDRIEINNK